MGAKGRVVLRIGPKLDQLEVAKVWLFCVLFSRGALAWEELWTGGKNGAKLVGVLVVLFGVAGRGGGV